MSTNISNISNIATSRPIRQGDTIIITSNHRPEVFIVVKPPIIMNNGEIGIYVEKPAPDPMKIGNTFFLTIFQDRSGIWQDKYYSDHSIPHQVIFSR